MIVRFGGTRRGRPLGDLRGCSAMHWNNFIKHQYFHQALGIYLDSSAAGLDECSGHHPWRGLEQAFLEMQQLESGALSNPDEGRMVGHYWLRAPDLAPTPQIRKQILSGQGQVQELAGCILEGRLQSGARKPFGRVLLIGIGGSALGPQFICDALADTPALAIDFLDNTDPDGIERTLDKLGEELSGTLVIVVSKSGGTPETRNGMLETRARFERLGLSFPAQAVAVTSPGSELDRLAQSQGWLARLPMFDWIGGRTSVFSAVGLLPAALQGVDIQSMLQGAALMDEATRAQDFGSNPAAQLALAWYAAGDGAGSRNMVILPYRDRLQLFGRYLQQLVMESLGKELDRAGCVVNQGLTVYGNKGSTDQHAYVQQLREGPDDFFVTFVEVLEDATRDTLQVRPGIRSGDYLYGFLRGTRSALLAKGRRCLVLTLTRIDATSIGALIALYERAVGLYASIVDINAYHQPGVEAGKRAAESVLSMQLAVLEVLGRSPEPLPVQVLAERAGFAGDLEEVYCLLRRLAATGRVILSGDFTEIRGLSAALS